MKNILETQNVYFEYNHGKEQSFLALKNINLNIKKGEYLAIVGSSGSGKTTLMNLLGLMATPTQGKLLFNGKNISELSADETSEIRNKNIGFIFQSFHLLTRLTVEENILLSLNYGEFDFNTIDKVNLLLSTLNIVEQKEKKPTALSGGQKQRVAMARALFPNPDLILADEPTGALDSKTTEAVLNIFDEFHRLGNTLVVITHNPDVAIRAERIIKITDGEIISDEINTNHINYGQTKIINNIESLNKIKNNFKYKIISLFSGMIKTLKTTFETILANKGRSLLTISGLTVGIISVLILLILSNEAKKTTERFIDSLGGNKGIVMSDGREAERLGLNRWRGLHLDYDFLKIEEKFKNYGTIDPIVRTNCTLNAPSETASFGIYGVKNDVSFKNLDAKIDRGRNFITDEYNKDSTTPTVIIGANIAEKLFPINDDGYHTNENYPIGAYINFLNCSFSSMAKVIGILEKMDADIGTNNNDNAYIPTKQLIKRGVKPYAQFFMLTPNKDIDIETFTISFKNYLALITENKFAFRHFTAQQMLQKVSSLINIIQIMMLLIGILCTIIGGIGVMNIMLVSVTERIKEIGIRKAVGAKEYHIRNQFLLESIVFCSLSGILGALVGVAIANSAIFFAQKVVPKYIIFEFSLYPTEITVAFIFSVCAGLIFGLLPAIKAAKMDVVEALRAD